MLHNTHPLILELNSLNFDFELEEDTTLIISLSKGFQTFGQLQFRVEGSVKTVFFQENNTIRFFYAPRVLTKKDVLYRITLIDVQSNEQVGQISLSANHLTSVFGNDKRHIIEKSDQFDEGISISYKIFMPKQVTTEPKIRLKQKSQPDDILNAIFSMAVPKKQAKRPSPVNNPEDQEIRQKPEAGFSLFAMLAPKPTTDEVTPTKSSPDLLQAEDKETLTPSSNINISKPGNQIMLFPQKNNAQQQKTPTLLRDLLKTFNSSIQCGGSSGLSPESSFIKEAQYQKQLRKRNKIPKLMSFSDHHENRQISLKLKLVIFLFVFGLLAIYYDFISDGWETQAAVV